MKMGMDKFHLSSSFTRHVAPLHLQWQPTMLTSEVDLDVADQVHFGNIPEHLQFAASIQRTTVRWIGWADGLRKTCCTSETFEESGSIQVIQVPTTRSAIG